MNGSGAWRSVVFFDLDAPLLRGPFESAVFPAVFAEIGSQTGLAPAFLRKLIMDEYEHRLRGGEPPGERAVDWQEILELVAGRCHATLTCDTTAIVEAHAGPPYAQALPGAHALLARLAAPQRALVAATNGLAKYQLPVLAGLNLLSCFTAVLTPDVHGVLKQERCFYGTWAEAGRVRISVGDQYKDDVLAPHSFGFRTIWKLNAVFPELAALNPRERPARAAALASPGTPTALAPLSAQAVLPDAIVLTLDEVAEVVAWLEQL